MNADQRFDRTDNYLLTFREEILRRLDVIDPRLDLLTSTVASLDSRSPAPAKAILESGSLSSQIVRDHADLTARVLKLEEQLSKLLGPAA